MFNYPCDTEPDPDEIASLEDAKKFIEKEKGKVLKQIQPLAARLRMRWADAELKIKRSR